MSWKKNLIFRKLTSGLVLKRIKDSDAPFMCQCSVTAKRCSENQSKVDIFIITSKFGEKKSKCILTCQISSTNLGVKFGFPTVCWERSLPANQPVAEKTRLVRLLPKHISLCHDQSSKLHPHFLTPFSDTTVTVLNRASSES